MSKQRVVIFGSGETGRRIYDVLKDREDVLFFVDNNAEKWGEEVLGLEVKKPDVLADQDAYDQVVIGAAFGTEDIIKQLEGIGVPPAKIETLYVELLSPVLSEKNALIEGKNAVIQGKNETIKQRNETVKQLTKQKNEVIKEKNSRIQNLSFYDSFQLCAVKYKEKEYEARWREIKREYDRVKIFQVDGAGSVGEIIPRYFAIRREEVEDPTTLKVFLMFPVSSWPIPRLCNRELFRLLNQRIYAPQGEDALFWYYIYRYHFNELDCSEMEKYKGRNYPAYAVKPNFQECVFSDEDVHLAEAQAREMRLKKDYVCVAARTATYNLTTRGMDGANSGGKDGYEYRNTNFMDYVHAINYLEERGFQTVRMGREETALEQPVNNCVDYAGWHANDLMDIYLAAHCQFMLITSTGLYALASLFGRPLVVVNATPLSCYYGAFPFTKNDIYIPKRYYDIHKKRYLSLREITQVEQECRINGLKYEEMGVRFEDNTPEEIQETVAEFLERLNGTWKDTAEDAENYKIYKRIHREMAEITSANPRQKWGGPIPFRISAVYLRKNKYLLQ